MLDETTFLHPRYKADFITTEPTTGMTDKVEDAINQSQLDVVKEELLKQAVFLSVIDPESTLSTEPPKKWKLTLGALTSFKKSEQPSPGLSSSPRDCLSKEVKTYLMYPVINGNKDPLQWWQRNRSKFLLMSQISQKYLCIQASSSPSE